MAKLMSRSAAKIETLKQEIRLLKKDFLKKDRIIKGNQEHISTSKLLRDEAYVRSR